PISFADSALVIPGENREKIINTVAMILKPRILRFFFSTLFSSPKVLKKCDISWCFIPKFLTSRKQFNLFDPYSLLSDSFLKGQHRHLVPDYNIMESNGKCCRILAKNLCISKIDNIVPFIYDPSNRYKAFHNFHHVLETLL